ncbi:unnamed protein product [Pedinophyceae sp. YPF-701]|nr:unnamed protein product [Pedinophyceae sp. YPF-701]
MDVEPIYCAEQIVIPPDLAEVLKSYTKEVIRRQPEDVVEFSAIYFSNLANATKSLKQFEAPKMPMLRSLVAALHGAREPVAPQELAQLAKQHGVTAPTVTKVFELDHFRDMDMILPREFIMVLVTMSGRNLKDAIASAFEVFSTDRGTLTCEDFVELFNILAYQDGGTEISEQLRQDVEGSFKTLPPLTLTDIYQHPSIAAHL